LGPNRLILPPVQDSGSQGNHLGAADQKKVAKQRHQDEIGWTVSEAGNGQSRRRADQDCGDGTAPRSHSFHDGLLFERRKPVDNSTTNSRKFHKHQACQKNFLQKSDDPLRIQGRAMRLRSVASAKCPIGVREMTGVRTAAG